jgi:hypothetical protein
VASSENCLKARIIRTARCKRSAVAGFKNLFGSFISAGNQLLTDAKFAHKEFNSMSPEAKASYVKGDSPAKDLDEDVDKAALKKFNEDVSNAASFALYVGNKQCIPAEHAPGDSVDASQVCGDDDSEMGLLDMGKKLQNFVVECPVSAWTVADQERKVDTQELAGDEMAVRIMRLTEQLTVSPRHACASILSAVHFKSLSNRLGLGRP